MKRLASLLSVLLLLMTAAPVMACVTGAAMSSSESACCRSMHGNCGDMVKQGCCRTEIRDQDPQAPSDLHAPDMQWVALSMVDVPYVVALQRDAMQGIPVQEPSPPPRSARPVVLRI